MLFEKLIVESFVLCLLEVYVLIEVGFLVEVVMWVWSCVILIFCYFVILFFVWLLKKFFVVN